MCKKFKHTANFQSILVQIIVLAKTKYLLGTLLFVRDVRYQDILRYYRIINNE